MRSSSFQRGRNASYMRRHLVAAVERAPAGCHSYVQSSSTVRIIASTSKLELRRGVVVELTALRIGRAVHRAWSSTRPRRTPLASRRVTVRPDTDAYDDVESRDDRRSRRGDGATHAGRVRPPAGDGPFPAVVIGAEGTGPNTYIRHLAATLSHLGFVAIVPDYYRGSGPPDTRRLRRLRDADVVHRRARLHGGRCTTSATRSTTCARSRTSTRRASASWGYCTGGTLALFVACLRHDLAASVVFFPSQPTFDAHDAKQPGRRHRPAVEHRVPDPVPDRRPGRRAAGRSCWRSSADGSSSGASTPT